MARFFCMLILSAVLLCGCSLFEEEKTYDWQRPHDTYQVGAFSKAANADALNEKLKKNGYESRIETEIVNGVFYLNVLVDVYEPTPDVKKKLEAITGHEAILRTKKQGGA